MKLILDRVYKIAGGVRFEICAHFVADSNEKQLYEGMVEAQRALSKTNSALSVSDGGNTLILNKASITGCKEVIKMFERNLQINVSCEVSDKCKSYPDGCEKLVMMELDSK